MIVSINWFINFTFCIYSLFFSKGTWAEQWIFTLMNVLLKRKASHAFMIPSKREKDRMCLFKSSEAHPLGNSFAYVIEEKILLKIQGAGCRVEGLFHEVNMKDNAKQCYPYIDFQEPTFFILFLIFALYKLLRFYLELHSLQH